MSKNKTPNKTDAPEAEAAAKPLPKGHYNAQNVAISNISIKKGFNPRTDLGDLSELKRSIKTHGIISPITVCPKTEGASAYFILAGHRRYTAALEAGIKTIPVVIRNVSIDSDEAFGLAMAENSDETRTDLTALDQAHAFQRLLDQGKSDKEVAGLCGYSSAHIRNTVKLNLVHKSVRERVAAGTLGKRAAIATLDIPESVRDSVVQKLGVNTTEQEVIKLANEAKREAKAAGLVEANEEKASNHNRPMGQTSGEKVLPRKTREVRDVISQVAVDMLNAAEDKEVEVEAAKANQLAALSWAMGMIPEIDITSDDFKKVVDDIRSRLEVVNEGDAPAEETEEEKPKKKSKKEAEPVEADEETEGTTEDEEEAEPAPKKAKKGKKTEDVEEDEDA